MKRIIFAAAFGLLPIAATAPSIAQADDDVTYFCSIDENCSSGTCAVNDPPFEFQLVHNKADDIGIVLFGDQSAETIAVRGMGTQDFMQLRDDSSVGFVIRSATGNLEVRGHGPAGSSLEKGVCKTE